MSSRRKGLMSGMLVRGCCHTKVARSSNAGWLDGCAGSVKSNNQRRVVYLDGLSISCAFVRFHRPGSPEPVSHDKQAKSPRYRHGQFERGARQTGSPGRSLDVPVIDSAVLSTAGCRPTMCPSLPSACQNMGFSVPWAGLPMILWFISGWTQQLWSLSYMND